MSDCWKEPPPLGMDKNDKDRNKYRIDMDDVVNRLKQDQDSLQDLLEEIKFLTTKQQIHNNSDLRRVLQQALITYSTNEDVVYDVMILISKLKSESKALVKEWLSSNTLLKDKANKKEEKKQQQQSSVMEEEKENAVKVNAMVIDEKSEGGGFVLWRNIMKVYEKSERIQYGGMLALFKLAESSTQKGMDDFVPCCTDTILSSMNSFPESKRVSECCCGVFAFITTSEHVVSLLMADNRMLQTIKTLLDKHKSESGIVDKACGILCNFAFMNPGHTNKIRECGIESILVQLAKESKRPLQNLNTALKHIQKVEK
jgi:hypothetical protein